MLWKPVTDGEVVFLRLYEVLSHPLSLQTSIGLEHLVSASLFQEYVRLAASLEITYRTMRAASAWYAADQSLGTRTIARQLRVDLALPPDLYQDGGFLEAVRGAARVAHHARAVSKGLGKDLYEKDGMRCYICGIEMQSTTPNAHDYRSADHLWPLSLGGATELVNLMPACRRCNSDRGHMVTWGVAAIGTYQRATDAEPFSKNWRYSWAASALMAAARRQGRRLQTLKSAAKEAEPLMSGAPAAKDEWYAYFETHRMIRA